jgi:hypothetical protein
MPTEPPATTPAPPPRRRRLAPAEGDARVLLYHSGGGGANDVRGDRRDADSDCGSDCEREADGAGTTDDMGLSSDDALADAAAGSDATADRRDRAGPVVLAHQQLRELEYEDLAKFFHLPITEGMFAAGAKAALLGESLASLLSRRQNI